MFKINIKDLITDSMNLTNSKERQRSDSESFTRVGLNSFKAGKVVDTAMDAFEFYGHRTRDNYNAYYQNNAMGHKDDFDRSWDAYKRATDIDYTGGGNSCNIF